METGKGIWELIHPKLKIFSWLLVRWRLLTNVHRVYRHLTMNPKCKHCPGNLSLMIHLFRDTCHLEWLLPLLGQ
ncbi:hypothetical protein RchiOBHm_Chr4g0426651 [Rosa chinensis]|uniref:Uncharacterized protein n=1 Tax=Rosa chinensis TaxID=74649 RepID=A0A2P6QZF3_ROSCH|nr:hypothetical protein RchiOBHm_Chr4g0426651 [Rosa chinensis]